MGFSLFSNGDKINYKIKNYVADTLNDLNNIPPSAPGSMAFVINDSDYYILNNKKEWEKQKNVPTGIFPEGSQTFIKDGIYDVTELAEVIVQTAPTKGMIFTDFDENGLAHGIQFIGVEEIPNFFLQAPTSSQIMLDQISSIKFDNNIKKIGNNAFERTKITEIEFPNSITTWGNYIVRNCTALKKCTFMGNVDMGHYLFNNDIALEEVHWYGNIIFWVSPGFTNAMRLYDFSGCTQIPTLSNVSWIGYGAGTVIRVPQILLENWKAGTNWCDLPTDTTLERYIIWEGV